jgi:hypothetical protein
MRLHRLKCYAELTDFGLGLILFKQGTLLIVWVVPIYASVHSKEYYQNVLVNPSPNIKTYQQIF